MNYILHSFSSGSILLQLGVGQKGRKCGVCNPHSREPARGVGEKKRSRSSAVFFEE